MDCTFSPYTLSFFHDAKFSSALCGALALCHRKKGNEKALVAASSPTAAGFLPYIRCIPKNDKLAALRQSRFFNGTPLISVSFADATNSSIGNALINVKAAL